MRQNHKTYKLSKDFLQQAARDVATCSLSVYTKQQELTKTKEELQKLSNQLLQLLKESGKKYIVVDNVKYFIGEDETTLQKEFHF